MNEGFCVNLNTALLFYRICQRYKINNEPGRIAVMRKLVAKKKAKYVRDAKGYLENFNVIKIDGKEPPNANRTV